MEPFTFSARSAVLAAMVWAAENPDVLVATIDAPSEASTAANVAQLTFAEQEGSYLVGAAAALMSKTDHIGFVGGVQTPLLGFLHENFTRNHFFLQLALHFRGHRPTGAGHLLRQRVHT